MHAEQHNAGSQPERTNVVKRKRVAIVGAGFSGVALAVHLARRGRGAPRVILIDKNQFGRGLAYGTEDRAHLLNVRASNMSLFADKPDHFSAWLVRRGESEGEFAARALYGRYIQNALARTTGLFSPVMCRRGEVVSCGRSANGWRLGVGDAEIEADVVVLAMGNRNPAPLPALEAAGIDAVDPWDASELRRIPQGDVLLLGTGLTMVDAALSLSSKRGSGVIYALSRRGLLPRAHAAQAPPSSPAPVQLPDSLSGALAAFRAEVQAAAARGEPWQFVMDRLRPQTTMIWRRLPAESQRRFLRHLRPWWDTHRHRMAPAAAKQIEALQRQGRLRVLAGELVSAEPRGRSILILHRQRGSLVRHRLQVAGVVNCTGSVNDPRGADDPLIQQMLTDGLARPHATGIGLDVDADGRVIDATGAAHADLFTIGPPTQGAFWESTAVPNIRVSAAHLAQLL